MPAIRSWIDLRTGQLPAGFAADVLAVERIAATPVQRLIVALAAVHAARTTAIRCRTLDDIDIPNRRITIAGHTQRLGELTHQTLRARLDQRRTT
ncbi:hypothetical protein ACFVYR_08920 [Streptomyces sp. NPDC058284]|uniref:hypothetical protein n=1 Tax=unclassified Streptomyces TaxID=2593676 RepID=UPI00365770F2